MIDSHVMLTILVQQIFRDSFRVGHLAPQINLGSILHLAFTLPGARLR